jgi:hypothetical protein
VQGHTSIAETANKPKSVSASLRRFYQQCRSEEIPDGDAAVDGHLSLVGRILAGDHAKERGLAGAVRADEADFLAPRQRRRRFDEQQMLAVLLGYAF